MAKINTPSNNTKQSNTKAPSIAQGLNNLNTSIKQVSTNTNKILEYLASKITEAKKKEDKERRQKEKQEQLKKEKEQIQKEQQERQKEQQERQKALNALKPNNDFTTQGVAIAGSALLHPAIGLGFNMMRQVGIDPLKATKSVFKLGFGGLFKKSDSEDPDNEKASTGAIGLTKGRSSTNKAIKDGCDRIVKQLKESNKEIKIEKKKEDSWFMKLFGSLFKKLGNVGTFLTTSLKFLGKGLVSGIAGLLAGNVAQWGVSELTGSERSGRFAGKTAGLASAGFMMGGPVGAAIGGIAGALWWGVDEINRINNQYRTLADNLKSYTIDSIEKGGHDNDPNVKYVKNSLWKSMSLIFSSMPKEDKAKILAAQNRGNQLRIDLAKSMKSIDDLTKNKKDIKFAMENSSVLSNSSQQAKKDIMNTTAGIINNELNGISPTERLQKIASIGKQLDLTPSQLNEIISMGQGGVLKTYTNPLAYGSLKSNELIGNNSWSTNNNINKDNNEKTEKYQDHMAALVKQLVYILDDTHKLASEGKFGNNDKMEEITEKFMKGGSIGYSGKSAYWEGGQSKIGDLYNYSPISG